MIHPLSCNAKSNFYPRSPCGERRVTVLGIQHKVGISIHALLAESDLSMETFRQTFQAISIHALLAESDALRQLQSALRRNFYPRSPCGERLNKSSKLSRNNGFLSTLSLRRATPSFCELPSKAGISIHALLAESDSGYQQPCGHPTTDFYPRSPCGERLHTCQYFFSNF